MPGLTASLDASPFPKESAPGSNWGRIEEGFTLFATQETSQLPSHTSSLDSFGSFCSKAHRRCLSFDTAEERSCPKQCQD